METQAGLIRLLADGQRHSGPALAESLGLSRAAVWKAIQRANQRWGVEIQAVKGQGYQLPTALELLDAPSIQAQLTAETRARLGPIQCFDELPSTNTWLMEQASQGARRHACVLAEFQSAGRGRRGRAWVSPFGANLYLSILWHFDTGPATLGPLSLAAGAAVAQALEDLGVPNIQLKWPNDIHWQRRKLGGLLIEVAGETQGPSRAVIGLGLNRRMPHAPAAHIDQPWVDLEDILPGQAPGRNQLAARCIQRLSAMLARFPETGSRPFLDIWRRFDGYRGQMVSLSWGEHQLQGRYLGIDDQGALRLDCEGEIRCFAAGELSLRPITETPVS